MAMTVYSRSYGHILRMLTHATWSTEVFLRTHADAKATVTARVTQIDVLRVLWPAERKRFVS